MNRLDLNPNHLAHHEDWECDNVAFSWHAYEKVFIVSDHLHEARRECPNCGLSTGHIRSE